MASPFALVSMEEGTLAGITTGQGATNKRADRIVGTAGTQVQVLAAAARTGGYGLRLVPTANIAHYGWQNTANGGRLTGRVFVDSFWFKFPTSLPAVDFNIWICIGTGGGNDAFIKFLQSTGGLQAVLGASTQLGPTGIVANAWHHIDIRVDMTTSPNTLDWRVDGVAQTSISLAVAGQDLLNVGFSSDNATQNGTIDIDDGVPSMTAADYPLGKHKIIQLVPDTGSTTTEISTANSTARMITNSAIDATHNSANILAALSEVPPLLGGSASGLGQRVSGTGLACEIPMTTYTLVGGETVTAVRAVLCAWAANASAAANTLGLRAWNGSAETTLFAAAAYAGQNSSTAPAWICKMYSGVTDQTTLNALALRVGYSGDISPLPGIHAAYAQVAIKESTSLSAALATATETDSGIAIAGKSKKLLSPVVSEADVAKAFAAITKKLLSPTVTETDTAQAIAGRSKKSLSPIATETDAAQVVGRLKRKAVSTSTEVDAAQSLGRQRSRLLLTGTETDAAQVITRQAQFSTATESDTAIALGRISVLAFPTAIETDSSKGLVAVRSRTVTTATTTDLAQTVGRISRRDISVATEADSSQSLGRRSTLLLPIATETELAKALSRLKTKALALANEGDSARLITRVKSRILGTTTEINTALVLARKKILVLPIVTEIDLANPILTGPLISVDITVTIGASRSRAQASILLSRPGWGIDDSRQGWEISESRDRSMADVEQSRSRVQADIESSRQGWDIGDSRQGVDIGESRKERT